LPAYRLPSPYDRPPLTRRASGLALALGVNVLLLLALLTLGVLRLPEPRPSEATVVDMLPEEHARRAVTEPRRSSRPVPKPPPIILPVKPTIAPPPLPPKETTQPWIEMSHDEMAAADVSNLPKASAGSREGDSEEVGRGPHGEVLYAAEWARHPTDAELGGYLPRNAPDGFGLIACKTIPGNRVDDCVELDQYPHGSRLAAAVRQAAWQFRIRPPRKNGRPMIGEWVQIRIDYEHITSDQ
jgi:protein TonB